MDAINLRARDRVILVNGVRVYSGMRLRDHPCDVFIDNPLFSELITPGAANPRGIKSWGRFVRQTAGQAAPAFVPEQAGSTEDYLRLEREWQRLQGGTDQPFDRLWGGWREVEPGSGAWLIAAPRDEIMQYWYGQTLQAWLAEITHELRRRGQAWEIRHKQDRKIRNRSPQDRIRARAQSYRGIITAHSVSAIDAILAGRPAIVWGQDPTQGLATPWQEWLVTDLPRLPTLAGVQAEACTWAATTWPTLDTGKAVACIQTS